MVTTRYGCTVMVGLTSPLLHILVYQDLYILNISMVSLHWLTSEEEGKCEVSS